MCKYCTVSQPLHVIAINLLILFNSIPHLFQLLTLYCTVHLCVPSPCPVLPFSSFPVLLFFSFQSFYIFSFLFLSFTRLFYPHIPHPTRPLPYPTLYPALSSQALIYFKRLMIFKARASMSTARRAVKGRARLRSSRTTTAPPLLSSTSLSFSSSFLAERYSRK